MVASGDGSCDNMGARDVVGASVGSFEGSGGDGQHGDANSGECISGDGRTYRRGREWAGRVISGVALFGEALSTSFEGVSALAVPPSMQVPVMVVDRAESPSSTHDREGPSSTRDRVHDYELTVRETAIVVDDRRSARDAKEAATTFAGAATDEAPVAEPPPGRTRTGRDQSDDERPRARSLGPRPSSSMRCAACHHRAVPASRSCTSLLALGVGVVHGIGGPGGVLAVLPTLFIPGALGSSLYLGAFCLAATLTMATVAGVFGACTHRARLVSSRLPWVLQCASATTSVGVGVLWLWCSATGTLAEVLAAMGME